MHQIEIPDPALMFQKDPSVKLTVAQEYHHTWKPSLKLQI